VKHFLLILLWFVVGAVAGGSLPGCDAQRSLEKKPGSSADASSAEAVNQTLLARERQAFFGDLHVHSSWSVDSYIFGNTNDPRDAYRFARGESVLIAGGPQTRELKVPLDFAAVTDHAETLGYYQRCVVAAGSSFYNDELCQLIRALDLLVYFKGFKNLSMTPLQHLPGGQLFAGAGGVPFPRGPRLARGIFDRGPGFHEYRTGLF
jgi:hypothetical protein